MIKKNIRKFNKLTTDYKSITQIINSSISSKDDLLKLCKKLNLDVKIDWIDNYDPNVKNQILNIDSDHIGGTHWIGICKSHYFDPLGFPIARTDDRFKDLEYTFIPVQNYKFGACGLFCCLFLYYCNNNDLDGFYNLFS